MLSSKDFFSFDAFKKQNQRVLKNTQENTYRKLVNEQAKKKQKYDIGGQFKFNVEILSDEPVLTTATKSNSDEEKKTASTGNLDFLNSVIASSKQIKSIHNDASTKPKKTVKAQVEKRQEKFFDHSKYNKGPSADAVPLSLFD